MTKYLTRILIFYHKTYGPNHLSRYETKCFSVLPLIMLYSLMHVFLDFIIGSAVYIRYITCIFSKKKTIEPCQLQINVE